MDSNNETNNHAKDNAMSVNTIDKTSDLDATSKKAPTQAVNSKDSASPKAVKKTSKPKNTRRYNPNTDNDTYPKNNNTTYIFNEKVVTDTKQTASFDITLTNSLVQQKISYCNNFVRHFGIIVGFLRRYKRGVFLSHLRDYAETILEINSLSLDNALKELNDKKSKFSADNFQLQTNGTLGKNTVKVRDSIHTDVMHLIQKIDTAVTLLEQLTLVSPRAERKMYAKQRDLYLNIPALLNISLMNVIKRIDKQFNININQPRTLPARLNFGKTDLNDIFTSLNANDNKHDFTSLITALNDQAKRANDPTKISNNVASKARVKKTTLTQKPPVPPKTGDASLFEWN